MLLRHDPLVPVTTFAGSGRQRRDDLAAAGHSGRHDDPAAGRQRGGRGHRRRRHVDRGRADRQRAWVGRLLHPVGRQAAARAERLRSRAGGIGRPNGSWMAFRSAAGTASRCRGAVSAWVELSERFGKLGLATVLAPAIGYAEEGVRRIAGDRRAVGKGRRIPGLPAWLRGNVHAGGTRAEGRRAVPQPRRRAHAEGDRGHQGPGLLRRRDRRGHRRRSRRRTAAQ